MYEPSLLTYIAVGGIAFFAVECGFEKIASSHLSERTKAIINGIGICVGLAGIGTLIYDAEQRRSEIKTMNQLESTVNNPQQKDYSQR